MMMGGFYKKKYMVSVYQLYIEGVDTATIAFHYKLTDDEVNDIIDFINYIIN